MDLLYPQANQDKVSPVCTMGTPEQPVRAPEPQAPQHYDEAWAFLVAQMQPLTQKLTSWLPKRPDVVEDVVQATLIKVRQKWRSIRADDAQVREAYVWKTARRLVVDRWRGESKFAALDETLLSRPGFQLGSHAGRVEAKEVLEILRRELNDKEFTVAVLFFGDDYASREIAEVLAMNQHTLRGFIARLRARISSVLRIAPPGAAAASRTSPKSPSKQQKDSASKVDAATEIGEKR